MQEQYTSFSPIQLAAEPAFISWIYDGTADVEWQAWMNAHPEMQSTIAQARQIVRDMRVAPPYALSDAEKTSLWNRIESSATSGAQQPPASPRLRHITRWSLAAAAALALLVWITTRQPGTTVTAAAGEHRSLTLPDESAITLNAGSDVSYIASRFEKDRVIKLNGEAFFEVTKGPTFKVETPQGTITVLGTSFNVIAREDRFEVSCYTGKVRVNTASKEKHLLTPGTRALENQDQHTLIKKSFDVQDSKPEWTKGKFVFLDQPLHVVVDELERQYKINVTLEPGLEDKRYVGFFESGDLEEALSLITWPLHMEAHTSNNTVSIVRKR